MEGRAVVHRCRSRRKFDARVRERLLKGELALLVVGLAVELLDAALLRFAVQIKDARGKKDCTRFAAWCHPAMPWDLTLRNSLKLLHFNKSRIYKKKPYMKNSLAMENMPKSYKNLRKRSWSLFSEPGIQLSVVEEDV